MTDETVNPQPDTISCDTFEELASPMLDGEVDGSMLGAFEAHRASCGECATFLSDLATIQREAGSLPAIRPSSDLWSGIAERITVPVVRLPGATVGGGGGGGGSGTTRRGGTPAWFRNSRNSWMAAAAAVLLVATSAGITYRLVAPDAGGLDPASAVVSVATPSADEPVPTPAGATDSLRATLPVPVERMPATGGAASPARLAADRPRRAGEPDVAGAYSPEIDRMRILLDQRRASLDTGTVRVLETNIAIIDRAIQESRAALARDPASALLNRQLSEALDEKLELMRTAVQLTSGD
ncbi:MAG: hypothetical protein ACYC2G_09280 [Gemmatimonadaceae bacterium]